MAHVITQLPSAVSSDLYDNQPLCSLLPPSPLSQGSGLDDNNVLVMDVTKQEMLMEKGGEDKDKDDVL
jgi:hypothetical protein